MATRARLSNIITNANVPSLRINTVPAHLSDGRHQKQKETSKLSKDRHFETNGTGHIKTGSIQSPASSERFQNTFLNKLQWKDC